MLAHRIANTQAPREVVFRTRGHAGGGIVRLASPGDLGELMKPFVFLDRFDLEGKDDRTSLDFGWHPHSGIATVTVVLDGTALYADTTGESGVLPAGSVEWMRAGNGVWHTGGAGAGRLRGFQLWVALPPELENASSESQYVMPNEIPAEGAARVILGRYGSAASPIASPPMNYLAVTLQPGERWTYRPPRGHTVAWVAVQDGALRASSHIRSGELAIFEPSENAIELVSEGATRFVLGSAPRHPHDLVLGNYSVHTNEEALRRGEAEIRRLGASLREEGKRSYALGKY
jgi:redox-sensitive bicupin YhaK (pirin superfamily)